jgi:hypothetical protein
MEDDEVQQQQNCNVDPFQLIKYLEIQFLFWKIRSPPGSQFHLKKLDMSSVITYLVSTYFQQEAGQTPIPAITNEGDDFNIIL